MKRSLDSNGKLAGSFTALALAALLSGVAQTAAGQMFGRDSMYAWHDHGQRAPGAFVQRDVTQDVGRDAMPAQAKTYAAPQQKVKIGEGLKKFGRA